MLFGGEGTNYFTLNWRYVAFLIGTCIWFRGPVSTGEFKFDDNSENPRASSGVTVDVPTETL